MLNINHVSNKLKRIANDPARKNFLSTLRGGPKAGAAAAVRAALPADPVKLSLSTTSSYHTGTIRASGNVPPNVPGTYFWHRAGDTGHFEAVAETHRPTYTPSIDDVGCRILCQWKSASDRPLASTYAEFGPLALDPSVEVCCFFAGLLTPRATHTRAHTHAHPYTHTTPLLTGVLRCLPGRGCNVCKRGQSKACTV